MKSLRIKETLRAITPPVVLGIRRRLTAWKWFRGDYPDWAAAAAAAQGYDTQAVFQQVLSAAREVRDGRAVWDRDGRTFHREEFHWPLLACLQSIAAENGGKLQVLDFGGALGSLWWQHRAWFSSLENVGWRIVEQPHLVEAGRAEFAREGLEFFSTIDECWTRCPPDVVLFSGVLAYLPDPEAVLAGVVQRQPQNIILDRMSYAHAGSRRLCVQHVPPSLYPGSYPCWLFDDSILAGLQGAYREKAAWDGAPSPDPGVFFRGHLFTRSSDSLLHTV